jgi:hypothetical protein
MVKVKKVDLTSLFGCVMTSDSRLYYMTGDDTVLVIVIKENYIKQGQ